MMRSPLGRLLAVGLVALLSARCVPPPPPPEPVGDAQLGGIYSGLGRAPGRGILRACGGRPDAAAARVAVESWIDLLRHVDDCRLDQVRYYASPDSTARASLRLGMLGAAPDACGAEARDLAHRLDRLSAEIRSDDWSRTLVCSTPMAVEDANASIGVMTSFRRKLDLSIARALPEVM